MTDFCKDCGRTDGQHQPECPAQPFPSIKTEDQVESDPRETYKARRELEAFIRGERMCYL